MKVAITSVRAMLVFTLLTGAIYPAAVTLLGNLAFPWKSEGSLVKDGDQIRGSELLAQAFTKSKYFWPRPSAIKYDAAGSGASNLSVTSADWRKAVQDREAGGLTHDLRFASGSGLDPHISPEAAMGQVKRVAEARQLNSDQIRALYLLVRNHTEERQLGFLGEPRVNVLKLNLAVDEHLK